MGAALIQSGIHRIEVPLNSPSALASIELLAHAFSADAKIGAGTVTAEEQVAEVSRAGATFVVSPNTSAEIVRLTKAAGLYSMPGVLTPTDCFLALKSGADALKLYPAQVLGTSGLKALRSVLPETTRIYPVGGVSADDLPAWLCAGAAGFGIGESLYSPGRQHTEVALRATRLVQAYDLAVRQGHGVL